MWPVSSQLRFSSFLHCPSSSTSCCRAAGIPALRSEAGEESPCFAKGARKVDASPWRRATASIVRRPSSGSNRQRIVSPVGTQRQTSFSIASPYAAPHHGRSNPIDAPKPYSPSMQN
ncbi:hypothetical protein Cob_v001202 [Colletotrichum orbiculare MAFF 240422]|uniref:Uncharacterized protein n=1 Tax=Colletotrichum orbiculare (strain 104-T / ATCC 96160 / CBS 514.97 / LARS 414 / MAFF 240422) TaxID=1213857 RepID=A0A484G8B1_COLOR|nr:hypothetical protein Cob_v001202 [Colletotrichum orbiculare MAFF 240422]